MAKNPINRFASASEVAALLERCLAHVQNPTSTPLPPVPGHRAKNRASYWAALVLPILGGLFVVTEATGYSHVMKALGTVLHFRTADGTLVVEIDDPGVKVTFDEKDLVINGAGIQEISLKPGAYTLRATKGEQTKTEIVSITQKGRTVVKVSFESSSTPAPNVPTFTMNFHEAPWRNVLEWYALAAELPLSGKVKPNGSFTFLAPLGKDGQQRKYTLTEALDLLNESLMQQNMLLVRKPNSLLIVPLDEPIGLTLYAPTTIEALAKKGERELAYVIYRPEKMSALDAALVAKKLLGPAGQVAHMSNDTVVRLYDMTGHLKQVVKTLDELDKGPARGAFGNALVPTPGAPVPTPGTVVPSTGANALAAPSLSRTEPRPRYEFKADLHEHVGIIHLAATPDGKSLIGTCRDGMTRVWDVAAGPNLWYALEGQGSPGGSFALSPDGKLAAVARRDHTIGLWEMASGKLRRTLKGHKDSIRSMVFTSDSKLLISAASSFDGGLNQSRSKLFSWNVADGSHIETGLTESDTVSMAITPDDLGFYIASSEGTIVKFKLENRTISGILFYLNQRDSVQLVARHPSTNTIAVAHGNEGRVSFWKQRESFWKQPEEPTASFSAHSKPITSLTFSSDGKLLLTASTDGTAKLWKTDTRELAATFAPQVAASAIGLAIFSADGNDIITAGPDGIVRFWDIRTIKNPAPAAPRP